VQSDEGPQQGDPLGPLLFCITVMTLVQRIKSQCNIWYMDNGTMGGHVDTLFADFQMLQVEGKKLGLTVNCGKCEIITNSDEVLLKFREIAPNIKRVRTASAMLLGAPIGGEQCIDDILQTKLKELRRLSDSVVTQCSRRALSPQKLFHKIVIHTSYCSMLLAPIARRIRHRNPFHTASCYEHRAV